MALAHITQSEEKLPLESGAIHVIAIIILVFTLIEVVALLDFFEKTDERSPDSIPSKLVEMEHRVEALERRREEEVEKARVYEVQRSLGYEFDLMHLVGVLKELPSDERERLKLSLESSLFLEKGMSLENVLLRAARSHPSTQSASAVPANATGSGLPVDVSQ